MSEGPWEELLISMRRLEQRVEDSEETINRLRVWISALEQRITQLTWSNRSRQWEDEHATTEESKQ